MTEIAFHFNAPDKLAYACRFARKVQRSGARLVIAAPADTLDVLDRMLWALASQDFVAHCRSDADEELVHASPVLLAVDVPSTPHQDVLLNLHGEVPEGFARFERLVEVVSAQDEARGYSIVRHDLVLKAG